MAFKRSGVRLPLAPLLRLGVLRRHLTYTRETALWASSPSRVQRASPPPEAADPLEPLIASTGANNTLPDRNYVHRGDGEYHPQ